MIDGRNLILQGESNKIMQNFTDVLMPKSASNENLISSSFALLAEVQIEKTKYNNTYLQFGFLPFRHIES